MSKQVIDGILKDWGERLFYQPVKGKKGRNMRGGGSTKTPKPTSKLSASATREKISRTAKKTPEVMVKITGGGKNMKHIKAHMDYISRNGGIEVEDENGDLHLGKEAILDVRDAWAKGRIGIPEVGEKRKEAFNIMLSMPPGTDRQSVKDAARTFAKAQFGEHQYIFSSHEDEKHPHVHLTVKAVDNQGVRLNPPKGDLQQWREHFAEKLREQGIAANATPRRTRGVTQKAEKQAIKHIDRDFKEGKRDQLSRVTQAQRAEIEKEIIGGKPHKNPLFEKILSARKQTLKVYANIAKALASGGTEDKALALEIVSLIKQMPSLSTRHEQSVELLKAVRKSYAQKVEPAKNEKSESKQSKPAKDRDRE